MPEPFVYVFTRPEFLKKRGRSRSIYEKTRGLSGVYILFTRDWICEYVGESYNVNERLRHWLKDKSLYNICVIRCQKDKATQRALEGFLILFFSPVRNIEISERVANKKVKPKLVRPLAEEVEEINKIKDVATIEATAQILEKLEKKKM